MAPKRPKYSKTTLADLTVLASARGLPTHGNKIDLIARLVKQDNEQYIENKRIEAEVQAATNTLQSPTQPRNRVPPRSNGIANGANARKNGWRDTIKRSKVSSGRKKTNGKEDTKCDQENHARNNNSTTDALVRSLMTESENTFPGTPSTVSNTGTRSTTSTRYGPITITPTAVLKKSQHKTWVTTTPTPASTPGERRFLPTKYGKVDFGVVALGIAVLITIGVAGVFVFKAVLLYGGVGVLEA